MPNLAELIFITFMVSVITSLIEFGITMENWNEPVVYSSNLIYEHTKMNWFGCWFCFILIRLVSPLYTIFALLMIPTLYIVDFIKWLFTVGRKDEDVN